MLNLGVVTRSFANMTPDECAARMQELGFACTELCFTFKDLNCWAYNGCCDVSVLTPRAAAEAVGAFRRRGIDIVSLGAFSNLFEPDEAKLAENFRFFERYIEVAEDNGIPFVSTEGGFIPGRRGVQTDTYEKDFLYFRDNMRRLADLAAAHGVAVAFEPCVLDLTPSAKRARDFLSQCERDNIRILLDPANLIANSDEEDMFKYLAPHVAYFHGKDRHVNDTYGCNVGDGEIDWVRFLRLYHEQTDGVPFILEYVNNDNCAEIRDRTLQYDRKALA